MLKRKFTGMQQHLIHLEFLEPNLVLFVTSVRSVSDNRMKNMSEVLSQLMHSAYFRSSFHQRISRSRVFPERHINLKIFQSLEMRNGILSDLSGVYQGISNGHLFRSKTSEQSQVFLFGLSVLKSLLHNAIGSFG